MRAPVRSERWVDTASDSVMALGGLFVRNREDTEAEYAAELAEWQKAVEHAREMGPQGWDPGPPPEGHDRVRYAFFVLALLLGPPGLLIHYVTEKTGMQTAYAVALFVVFAVVLAVLLLKVSSYSSGLWAARQYGACSLSELRLRALASQSPLVRVAFIHPMSVLRIFIVAGATWSFIVWMWVHPEPDPAAQFMYRSLSVLPPLVGGFFASSAVGRYESRPRRDGPGRYRAWRQRLCAFFAIPFPPLLVWLGIKLMDEVARQRAIRQELRDTYGIQVMRGVRKMTAPNVCPHCRVHIPEDANVCAGCGAEYVERVSTLGRVLAVPLVALAFLVACVLGSAAGHRSTWWLGLLLGATLLFGISRGLDRAFTSSGWELTS